ncbi:MAG TPA: hypothetical protein VKY54_15060 [Kiloniellales bacterium]|nr:hypothetical protein [Kiloniellales bacterium]
MNRLVLLLIVAVAAGIAGFLFQVKYRVQDLEQELATLNQQIRVDREAMHVLRTEWSYLNQPERISELAARHLEMGLMEAPQVLASFEVLPPRPEDFGYAQADLENKLPQPRPRPTTPAGWPGEGHPEIRMASAAPVAAPSAAEPQVSRSAAPAPEPVQASTPAAPAPAEPLDDIGDKIAQLMGETVTPVLEQDSYEASPRALPISANGGVLR